MKVMYCWRCKMDVPMLDEKEFTVISELFSQGMHATKEFRQKYNLPSEGCSITERFRPVCEAYQKLTGFEETNHNAIMHHRISIYGQACKNCGKPLRTPQASFCAACGEIDIDNDHKS
jgi:hypothetical protein